MQHRKTLMRVFLSGSCFNIGWLSLQGRFHLGETPGQLGLSLETVSIEEKHQSFLILTDPLRSTHTRSLSQSPQRPVGGKNLSQDCSNHYYDQSCYSHFDSLWAKYICQNIQCFTLGWRTWANVPLLTDQEGRKGMIFIKERDFRKTYANLAICIGEEKGLFFQGIYKSFLVAIIAVELIFLTVTMQHT